MVRKLILAAFAGLIIFSACGGSGIRVGHQGGFLSAALYGAIENDADFNVQQFDSSSDIAYALIAGVLDAGFIETDRLTELSAIDGFDALNVIGVVEYPFGATVILREGLDNRINEIDGLNIAASSPNCDLLEVFLLDLERLDVNSSGAAFDYMPFHAMLPALSAEVTDAAVIKGTYAVTALARGHQILYQNWDMEAGDACCPAVIDQAALVLLASSDTDANAVTNALTLSLSADELRRLVSEHSGIPFEILQNHPVPVFSLADNSLLEILLTDCGIGG